MNLQVNALRAATLLYPLNTPRASILRRLPAIPWDAGEIVGKKGVHFTDYWKDDDAVSRSLYWFGDFDPWVNFTVGLLAKPGSVALDVGANVGATAITIARAVGPLGKLVCFEPIPQNAEKLRRNLAANKIHWAEVESVALSDRAATASMSMEKNQAGMSRIIDSSSADSIPVHCVSYDEWSRANRDPRISVCKVDVEGHEDRVFTGMQNSFDRIESVVFERHNAVDADPVFTLLQSHGFEIFRIEKGFVRTYFRPLGSPPIGRATTDFVAVKPGSMHVLTNS